MARFQSFPFSNHVEFTFTCVKINVGVLWEAETKVRVSWVLSFSLNHLCANRLSEPARSDTKKNHAKHRANIPPCPERKRERECPYVGSFSHTARWTMGKQTVFTSFTSFALYQGSVCCRWSSSVQSRNRKFCHPGSLRTPLSLLVHMCVGDTLCEDKITLCHPGPH